MKRQSRILAGTAIGLLMASVPLGASPLSGEMSDSAIRSTQAPLLLAQAEECVGEDCPPSEEKPAEEEQPAPAEEAAPEPEPQPEPAPEPEPTPEAAPEPAPEPAYEPPAHGEAPPQESEQPRRRSTVREPAVVNFDDQPSPAPYERHAPAPAPANDSEGGTNESEIAPERPRRSGWWQRR